MKSIVILFAIQLAYNYVSGLECNGANERASELTFACPLTCSHPYGRRCVGSFPKPSCVCTGGTVRDTINNRCVRPENCHKQNKPSIKFHEIVCNGLNEKYQEWISACPDHCPTPGSPPLPEKCHAIINKPSCVCTNGTIRDTVNRRCVRPQDCPKKEAQPVLFEDKQKIVCNAPNEIYQEWRSACPSHCPATGSPPLPEKCHSIIMEPSCVCTAGTIRDNVNKRCVRPQDCPKKEAQPVLFEEKPKIVCNAPNEIYQEWISACPAHCPRPDSPPLPETCHAIINKPSCVCTKGTIRDTINQRCVTRNQCPKTL